LALFFLIFIVPIAIKTSKDTTLLLFLISNSILHLRLQLLKSRTASQAGVARFLVSFQVWATH
jgi:hypothetical protein